ncbi:hypothetical protein I4U23_019085 [Adineta vaga]|nr:hypothetical protein I4U23_019085 [Adineta vaga]
MTNKKTTFDSIPNELLLIIFSYLSSFDLCQAFLDLKNARIQYLLTSIQHSLNFSLMHYKQLYHWLSSNQDDINRFTALINTVILDESCACRKLYRHWQKTFHQSERSNVLFVSIKKIFILHADYYMYDLIQSMLKHLVFDNNTLQYLHIIFKELTHNYSLVL